MGKLTNKMKRKSLENALLFKATKLVQAQRKRIDELEAKQQIALALLNEVKGLDGLQEESALKVARMIEVLEEKPDIPIDK